MAVWVNVRYLTVVIINGFITAISLSVYLVYLTWCPRPPPSTVGYVQGQVSQL